MKPSYAGGLLTILFFFQISIVHAQDDNDGGGQVTIDIPEVAILDLESEEGSSISLNIEAGEEAGDPVDLSNAVDSSLWLNYSSVVGSSEKPHREIWACFTAGRMPPGLRLRVKCLPDAGGGDGSLGSPNNEVSMSYAPRKMITNIGSCYTGDGVGSGHQIVYRLELINRQYRRLNFDRSGAMTILYTFVD